MSERREAFVFDRPEYRFSLEPYRNFYFVHVEVRRYNPRVRRELQELVDRLSHKFELRVFADADNAKLIKMSALFGFQYTYEERSPHDSKLKLILTRGHYGRII